MSYLCDYEQVSVCDALSLSGSVAVPEVMPPPSSSPFMVELCKGFCDNNIECTGFLTVTTPKDDEVHVDVEKTVCWSYFTTSTTDDDVVLHIKKNDDDDNGNIYYITMPWHDDEKDDFPTLLFALTKRKSSVKCYDKILNSCHDSEYNNNNNSTVTPHPLRPPPALRSIMDNDTTTTSRHRHNRNLGGYYYTNNYDNGCDRTCKALLGTIGGSIAALIFYCCCFKYLWYLYRLPALVREQQNEASGNNNLPTTTKTTLPSATAPKATPSTRENDMQTLDTDNTTTVEEWEGKMIEVPL